MPYRLFLDDERMPVGDDFVIVRDYNAFVAEVTHRGLPSFISFDHDLGEGRTGYDCAKWLVDHCLDNGLPLDFEIFVHSQNPIGKRNIEAYFESARRFAETLDRPGP